MNAVSARELTVRYGDLVALDAITIEVPRGSSVAVLGPNGSGKSTLFAAIVGLARPRGGSIEVGSERIAWLPQQPGAEAAFPATVRDIVAMGRWGIGGWLRRADDDDRRLVSDAIDALGLRPLAGRAFGELSGGERQRALLAQAMARDADLTLLDEPLTGVDRPTTEAIGRVVERWHGEGRTVMVATHDLEAAARDYDLVVALNRRLIAFGPAAEVCTEERLRETFSGHVVRVGDELVDTSHHHPGAA